MDDEKQADVTVDLYAALDLENLAVNESVLELEDCQTLGLLTGFLRVDDWYVTDHDLPNGKREKLLWPSLHFDISFNIPRTKFVNC